MSIRETIINASNEYQSIGLSTIMGYCYMTKTGKSFVPETNTSIPFWKINALQIIPDTQVLIVDIDSKEVELPCDIPQGVPTVITQSGNRHYWFKPDQRLNAAVNTHIKIDVLTGHKPVIVPPSQVECGGTYKRAVPFQGIAALPQIPEELLQFLIKYQQPEKKIEHHCSIGQKNKRVSDLSTKQQSSLYNALSKCSSAEQGERSNADYGFIIWGLQCGVSENELWNLCKDVSKFKVQGFKYFQITVKNASVRLMKG